MRVAIREEFPEDCLGSVDIIFYGQWNHHHSTSLNRAAARLCLAQLVAKRQTRPDGPGDRLSPHLVEL
jgi:hypothetical protein